MLHRDATFRYFDASVSAGFSQGLPAEPKDIRQMPCCHFAKITC